MQPIIVELVRYNRFVLGRVLQQDEAMRNENPGPELLFGHNGFTIQSGTGPSLSSTGLWLWGKDRLMDSESFYCEAHSISVAIELFDRVKAAVEALNVQWANSMPVRSDIVVEIVQ